MAGRAKGSTDGSEIIFPSSFWRTAGRGIRARNNSVGKFSIFPPPPPPPPRYFSLILARFLCLQPSSLGHTSYLRFLRVAPPASAGGRRCSALASLLSLLSLAKQPIVETIFPRWLGESTRNLSVRNTERGERTNRTNVREQTRGGKKEVRKR